MTRRQVQLRANRQARPRRTEQRRGRAKAHEGGKGESFAKPLRGVGCAEGAGERMGGGDDDGRQAVRLHTELTPCDPPATVSGTATAEAVGAPSVQRKHSSADVGGLAQRPTQRGRRADAQTAQTRTPHAHARPHARAHDHADTGSTRSRARRLGRGPMSRWRCCRHTEEACGCASAVLCCFALNEMSTAGDALPVALTQWGGLQRHVPFADRMGPCDRTRREMPLVRNAPIPCNNMPHHATK